MLNEDFKRVFDCLSPAQKTIILEKLKQAQRYSIDTDQREPELDILKSDTSFSMEFPEDRTPPTPPFKAILLTGTTGFVGSHVLSSYLRKTDAHVYCVVRGDSQDHAKSRLIMSMKSRRLWHEGDDHRITVFKGDLSENYFGLPVDTYRALSFLVDSIVHCAGLVNFAFSYSMIRGTALGSTQHLLKFAILNRLKKFNFISSYSAMLSFGVSSDQPFSEAPLPDEPFAMHLGYIKSKWVAEKLLQNAAKQGISVSVLRLGNVMTDLETGIGNPQDLFNYIPEFCVKRRIFPDVDFQLDFSPVNFVRDAVVAIAQKASTGYDIFNVVNPNHYDLISLKKLTSRLSPVMTVPFDEWVSLFTDYLRETVPEYSFSLLFQQEGFSLRHLVFPSEKPFQTDGLTSVIDVSPYLLEPARIIEKLFVTLPAIQPALYTGSMNDVIDSILTLNQSQRPTILQSFIHQECAQAGLLLDHVAHSLSTQPLQRPFKSFFCSSRYEAVDGLIKLSRQRSKTRHQFLCFDPDGSLLAMSQPLASFDLDIRPGVSFFKTLPELMARIQQTPHLVAGVLMTLTDQDSIEKIKESSRHLESLRIPMFIDISMLSLDNLPVLPFKFSGMVAGPMLTNYQLPSAVFCVDKTTYSPWNTIDNCILHTSTYAYNLLLLTSIIRSITTSITIPTPILNQINEIGASHQMTLNYYQKYINPKLKLLLTAIGMANMVVSAHQSVLKIRNKQNQDVECVDALGSFGCSLRGHSPADMTDHLATFNPATNYITQLKEEMCRISGLSRCFISVSGASAVDMAMSMALLACPEKPYIIVFKGGFAGKTLLSLSGTAKDKYRKPFGPLYDHVLFLDPWKADFTSQFDALIKRYPVGLVWFELIQGEAGIRPVPESVITHIQAARKEHHYLIGLDEIQSGLYRTGTCFNFQRKSLTPDIITVAKGLSDMTFPNACVLVTEPVYRAAKKNNAPYMALADSHFNHQVGAFVALNALKKAQDLNLQDNAQQMGDFIISSLKSLEGKSLIRKVRGEGLMIGLELDDSKFPFQMSALKDYVSALFCGACMKLAPYPVLVAFTLNSGNIVRIEPALTLTKDEALKIVNCISFVAQFSPLKVVSSAFR